MSESSNTAQLLFESAKVKDSVYKFDETSELNILLKTDVSKAGNFYDSVYAPTKKRREELTNVEEKIQMDKEYYKLMNLGFNRRVLEERDESDSITGRNMLKFAAIKTGYHLELGKSKDEQLRDIKKVQLSKRTGVTKFVPQILHKYIDFLQSLRIQPSKQDLFRNGALGCFISFVIWANMSARSSFMYFVIGNLATISLLLARNMPQVKLAPGMEKRKVASWSGNAFKAAVAITLLHTAATALVTGLFTLLLPLNNTVRAKAAMIASMLGTAYFTAFYEVFEEKSKNGMRWAKSLEGNMTPDLKERLATQFFGSKELGDKYDYAYNPQVDDYPPLPKYLDEVEGKAMLTGGSNEIDEEESLQHYDDWHKMRRDSRKAPVEYAAPETPWVGSKKGLYVKKIPTWLSTAYHNNVLKANNWRNKPRKYVKNVAEFELIDGPIGFRDKKPEWLSIFGTGVWEEKTTVSRRAARAFGSYRKTMWKIDKEVKLMPCDGADKEPNK